jgi:hypothetical protein
VAISKRTSRYTPTPVPQSASNDIRHWLTEETDLIATGINLGLDLNDILVSIPAMYLYGNPGDLLLTPVDVKIENYANGASDGNVPVEPDPVTGDITIPETGLYSGTAFIYGEQGNPDKNEQIHMLVDIQFAIGGSLRYPISVADVATQFTTSRVLNGSLTGQLSEGDVMSLWMSATADLGLLTTEQSTFELLRVR